MTGMVFEIKKFAVHDGDGIRTTVFLKGCPLKCVWCHNPEGIDFAPALAYYEHKCIGCGACVDSCSVRVHVLDGVHGIYREKCGACDACAESCPTGALELCGKNLSVEEILSVIEKDRAFYGERGGALRRR